MPSSNEPAPGAVVAQLRIGLERDGRVAADRPRLRWIVRSDREWIQESADIELSTADRTELVRHQGRESAAVPWPFPPLEPRATVRVRVRARSESGAVTPWSDHVEVTSNRLRAGEWIADFIGLANPSLRAQPIRLRTEFEVDRRPASATFYSAALGLHQAAINGVDVDDAVLKPGWTPYRSRIALQVADVTALIREGANAIGIRLAGGWFTERFGWGEGRSYGEQPAAAAQLHLRFADGSERWIPTSADWLVSGEGPVIRSGIYQGAVVDLRKEVDGWDRHGFVATGWHAALVREHPVVPEPTTMPPTRRHEALPVAEVLPARDGRILLDFGQNLVGWVRIRLDGPEGTKLTIRHAEVLDQGELATRPLRTAAATDSVILSGRGPISWEPEFTIHGFRYAEIDGWPGAFDPNAVQAIVVHSDMQRTGWFESSHELLDRLHENIVWGMRGNFVSLPTDCPQRDERMGWTGDAQVFAPTASFLFDCEGFLRSWLRDLALEQSLAGGVVPYIVPNALGPIADEPVAGWGDAAVIVPSVLYERFGDIEVLRDQFDSIRAWVDTVSRRAAPDRIWEGDFQYGDWLDPSAPPDNMWATRTDADLLATAYFARTTQLAADAARAIGASDEGERFGELAAGTREAWRRRFVTPDGRLMSDSQTAYAMALEFGLVDDEQLRSVMGARLGELVRRAGYRIGTGFLGTPLVCDALVDAGLTDVARRLLLQTQCPSWLYAVTMSATTIWERWDGLLPDGSLNPGEMTSFNHYAFGSIGDFLHRRIAGLAPLEPGYKAMVFEPTRIVGLEHAAVRLDTPYGRAEAGWRTEDGQIHLRVVVPANTTCEVRLPDGRRTTVGSGEHSWSAADSRTAYVPRPLSETSTLAQLLVDDERAAERLLTALDAVDSGLAQDLRARVLATPDRSLRGPLTRASPAGRTVIAQVLAELNERVR